MNALWLVLLLAAAAAGVAYLQTPGGLQVLVFGFACWCGGLVVEAMLDRRRDRER